MPAASTGLFGLKPTRGRVSLGPDADEVFSGLAVHGGLSRTVRDSAALLDLIQGPETGDPYFAERPHRPYLDETARDPGRLRVGLATTPWSGREVEPAVRAATLAAARLLESLGHRVEVATVDLGVDWEEFRPGQRPPVVREPDTAGAAAPGVGVAGVGRGGASRAEGLVGTGESSSKIQAGRGAGARRCVRRPRKGQAGRSMRAARVRGSGSGPDGDHLTLIMKLPGNRVPSACVSVV